MTGNEQKIDNTFNRVMDEINRLQKAFQPQKNLEKAIAEVGGDISWLKDINEAFDNLYDKLEEGHMGAVAHLQMGESKEIKESVLDSDDDDGFMARSQLYFLARDAINLHGMIDDRSDLEPWVQSKIAQASKDIDAVRRYTEYNAMEQNSPEPEVPAVIPSEEPQDEMPTIDVQMTPAEESVVEEKDPDTEFVRWLKDKYNKSPRDLKGDEYVKMSKEFQASKKKDESINEEMKFDDKRDADLKVFAKDLYKKAVKKAKTVDVDKVRNAMYGQTFPNLTGGTAVMLPNHHLAKPVLIGEIQADGQFDIISQTKEVPGDAWTDFLPESKVLVSDWKNLGCGMYNKETKTCVQIKSIY